MIYDRICESRKVNSVSLYAEALWVRIITKADDNGNFWRKASKVHAICMDEKDGASPEKTSKALEELLEKKLLFVYTADGREYVHIADFHDYQELRGDKNARIEHPVHPPELGGAYIGEGLRRDTWVDQKTRLRETELEPAGNRPVTQREPTGTPEVEVKEEEEGQVEDSVAQLTSADVKTFKTVFREQTGAKGKLGAKTGEKLAELCGRYGLSAVLDALPKWVEDEGGKQKIQNDKRKREWACSNFLRDAEEIIQATKAGAFNPEPEKEPDEVARVAGPRGVGAEYAHLVKPELRK